MAEVEPTHTHTHTHRADRRHHRPTSSNAQSHMPVKATDVTLLFLFSASEKSCKPASVNPSQSAHSGTINKREGRPHPSATPPQSDNHQNAQK